MGGLVESSKHLTRHLLTIGENRLELLLVEVQEERERFMHAILLALGVATCCLLAGISLTGFIILLLWNSYPVAALISLMGLYVLLAFYLQRRLARLLQEWKTLPATLEQLRKDRECLDKGLA